MKQILLYLIISFLLMFSIYSCDNSTESNDQPNESSIDPIVNISYIEEISSDITDTLASFNLTTDNLCDLEDLATKEIFIEGARRIKIEVLNYQELGNTFIVFGFEGPGKYFAFRGLNYIGGEYGRITCVLGSSTSDLF